MTHTRRQAALVIASGVLALVACAACVAPHVRESDLPRATPDKGGLFSARIVGHWRAPGDRTCAEGPMVTLDGPRITITHGVAVTVYEIASDGALELRAKIVQPASAAGAMVAMRPEFNATSEARSFNLIVENETAGTRQNWAPCEVR
jgi:hypothetical protein